MRVLSDSWCFCNGGGKSERMKAGIFSGKAPAMARVNGGGTGFLIHRNLLLTTHANLPSVAAAEAAEIRIHNGLSAALVPHRFFITSSVLDLTMVGLDAIDGESNAPPLLQSHYLKTFSKPNLELGNAVYLMGYTEKLELSVGEGKVVIATDNLIKLSTDGVTWSPGSAGFDDHGNLAFMVCDPMKLATSPNTKSSSTSTSSTSSWKKDFPMQFGIPIPVILDWLHQHWDGNLDELNKPKLPLLRLMSSGQKSEHSCASFTMRRVFKSAEGENEAGSSPSIVRSKQTEQPGPSSAIVNAMEDENFTGDSQGACATREAGIPTPEIYESRMLSSAPVKAKDVAQVQLLDINFPPRTAKASIPPKPSKKMVPKSDQNFGKDSLKQPPMEAAQNVPAGAAPDAESTGSVNGGRSEAQSQSSSSPVEISGLQQHECSSDGETTMYSAETAESRNIPSPVGGRLKGVGRSQSCVNYNNRWGTGQKTVVARGALLEKHRSFTQVRKVCSQGATSQRSNDYFSPTLSSLMKKRNLEQQQNRPLPPPPPPPRQSAVQTSPRWMF
ncbi:uncharacterized protein LOC127259201 [Andrographis paniculata]|uniref:uncharacterized protein LOC127259201 n=1 Tax=Andrographis paniculata TaxID=175694 RepID=UPI0021E82685|nr:uncharacterized protein LOC127259201 [Andrographis paniculata]